MAKRHTLHEFVMREAASTGDLKDKLTPAQARVLKTIAASPDGMGFRDEYGRATMDVLIRRGLIDAPIGNFGRVFITDWGRAALSHREAQGGDRG